MESAHSTNPALIKAYAIANYEVAKNGKASKTATDNAKLFIEAKVNLDHIVRVSGMQFDKAKNLSVANLKIAGKKTQSRKISENSNQKGLKAQLVQVKSLNDQTGYTAQLIGKTIISPIASEIIEYFLTVVSLYFITGR